MVQLAEILESGVPVTILANTIQMAGVMEGKHTIDVGMLVLPMLMEMIMMVGDSAGVEYNNGLEDKNKPKTRDSLIAKVSNTYSKEIEDIDLSTDNTEVKNEEKVMEEPKGLMARRT